MAENENSDGWDSVLADIARQRETARAMGGEERLRKHRAAGKLDVRARIAYLLAARSSVVRMHPRTPSSWVPAASTAARSWSQPKTSP